MTSTQVAGSPGCGDSPLSTTGSVVGILTFALGLLAYLIAFLTITRGADQALAEMLATLDETDRQILGIKTLLDDAEREADPDYDAMKNMIDGPESSFRTANNDFERLLEPFSVASRRSRPGRMSLFRRFRWWYRDRDLAAATIRLENRRQHFATIQLTYVLRYFSSFSFFSWFHTTGLPGEPARSFCFPPGDRSY